MQHQESQSLQQVRVSTLTMEVHKCSSRYAVPVQYVASDVSDIMQFDFPVEYQPQSAASRVAGNVASLSETH